MARESIARIHAENPEFRVVYWMARGHRVYTVSHLPSGRWSRCSVGSLASARNLIENFAAEESLYGYWSRPGEPAPELPPLGG